MNKNETRVIIKDANNVRWCIGTFEQLRKVYKSKKATMSAINQMCLLIRSGQLNLATLPFATMIK